MSRLKHIGSVLLALALIVACYGVALTIVSTFKIETVIASAALGYAILRTIVAALRKFEMQS